MVGLLLTCSANLFAATVGTVIPILGQPGTIAYDPNLKNLFISNTTQNRIEVFSANQNRLLASIPVGRSPYGITYVPEFNVILVCNTQEKFLTMISVTSLGVTGTIPITQQDIATTSGIPENPYAIASLAGNGGIVVSTNYGLQYVSLIDKNTTPITFPNARIPASADLVLSGDRTAVLGEGGGVAFLYRPSTGSNSVQFVEQIRKSVDTSVMAVDRTGNQFMIVEALLNRQFNQTSAINPLTAGGSKIGGVVFSPDNARVYAGYDQSPGAQIAVLSAADLRLQTIYRVPEAINGRMIVTPDGAKLFAVSTSGLTVVELADLASLPLLSVNTHTVTFSFQACFLGPVNRVVDIGNTGGGSFTWTAAASDASIKLGIAEGSGPGSLIISVDPNNFQFRGTATLGEITVSSPESINGDQKITILANVTNPDQVGALFPLEGFLSDILVDDLRQRVYLSNTTKNQIEVFSIAQRAFLNPIAVGAIPKSLAFSNNRSRVLVTHLGTESMTVIDAESLSPVATVRIPFAPPDPANAAPDPVRGTHPLSVAIGADGVALVVGSTFGDSPRGTVYRVSQNSTLATLVSALGSSPNAVNGRSYLAASGNGTRIFLAEGGGSVDLFDQTTGNFAISRFFNNLTLGNVAASSDGTNFHAGTQFFNGVIVPRDTIPSSIGGQYSIAGFAFSPTGSTGYRGVRPNAVTNTSPAPRIEKLDATTQRVVSLFNIAEALVPSSSNVLFSIAHQLAVNSSETTLYGISESGLLVIPLPGSGQASGPKILSGGIVNGASFALAPAPVSPGSIATIFGSDMSSAIAAPSSLPLPTVLNNTCVTFDGIPAPFFFVSPGQLNVQVPWELAGKSSAQVAVGTGDLSSQPVTVNLGARAPGIFTISGDGQGVGAVLHSSNFSLVTTSNPAQIGEIISIYATGVGPTSIDVKTGAPAPVDGTLVPTLSTPTVTVGGANAQVLFSGLAPGFVGLYQVDVRVPSNAVTGTNAQVIITAGGSVSNKAIIAVVPAR